jgi:hypothetical protein
VGRQAKTQNIIDQAHEILEAYHPMTVRQVYYQLVSRQVIENNRSRYQAVSNALVDARLEEIIPWDWIEDWLRKPHSSDGSYVDLAALDAIKEVEKQEREKLVEVLRAIA